MSSRPATVVTVTDIQFGALITALLAVAGTIGGAIKWAVGRITKALDDNTASNNAEAASKIILAERLGGMMAKIDAVSTWIERHPTPIRGVPTTTAPPIRDPGPTPRAPTQGGGEYSTSKRRP